MPNFDNVTIGQILQAAAPLAAVWALARWAGPTLHRAGRVIDDLQGEEARPGVKARPGMLERMASQEAATEATAAGVAAMRQEQAALSTQVGGLAQQVAAILPAVAQLQPNHGSSLVDAIQRIELDTARAVGRQHTPVTQPAPGP